MLFPEVHLAPVPLAGKTGPVGACCPPFHETVKVVAVYVPSVPGMKRAGGGLWA